MLYTLSELITKDLLQQWLPLLTSADVLLLSENGVYNALHQSEICPILLELPCKGIYALEQDVLARGITSYIAPQITVINDLQWVELTLQYYPQVLLCS